jgi:hypothetical protein
MKTDDIIELLFNVGFKDHFKRFVRFSSQPETFSRVTNVQPVRNHVINAQFLLSQKGE